MSTMLFIVFINYFLQQIFTSTVSAFPDNTTLRYEIEGWTNIWSDMNNGLIILKRYYANKMLENVTKTKHIHFDLLVSHFGTDSNCVLVLTANTIATVQ